MDTYFLQTLSSPRSVKQYINTIQKIAKEMGDKNDFMVFANHYRDVKSWLSHKAPSTQQKYATIIRSFIPYLKLEKETEKKLIRYYLDIAKYIQNPEKPRITVQTTTRVETPHVENKIHIPKYTDEIQYHVLVQKLPQREITKKNYMRYIEKFLQHHRLSVLIENPNIAFKYLKSLSDAEVPTAYSAFVAFIKVMTINEQDKNRILKDYLSFFNTELKSKVEKKRESYKRDDTRNLGYNYQTLREAVQSVITKEKNPEYKLLMSIMINTPPLRTSNIRLHVNIPDNGKDNVLVWKKNEKKFIFNSWKNQAKMGAHVLKIVNKNLIHDIDMYLKEHPDTKILLDHKQTWVTYTTQAIRKKYNIPLSVYDLRHMFATWLENNNVNEHQKERLAQQMGTSLRMLHKTYSDVEKNADTGVDDVEQLVSKTTRGRKSRK